MQIEEKMREFRFRKNVALDPPPGADKKWLHQWITRDQFARDGETGIQMSAGSSSGENDPHAATAIGSVADSPITFSRVLPMFTRMPVKRSVNTRFDRP